MAGRKQLVEKPTWASTRRTSRCTRYTQNEPLDNAFAIRSIFLFSFFPIRIQSEKKPAARKQGPGDRPSSSCADSFPVRIERGHVPAKQMMNPMRIIAAVKCTGSGLRFIRKCPSQVQPIAPQASVSGHCRKMPENAWRSPRLLSVGSSTPYRIQNDSA